MKKLLASMFVGAVAAVALVLLFDRYLSPDLVMFRTAAERSETWAEQLRETDGPCYILCGSSDVRIGMDPESMMEEGVRAVNSAYNAGYGQNYLLMEALRLARKGDTLVLVPLSPANEPDDQLTGTMKQAFQRHGFDIFEPGLIACSPGNICKIFTGDIRNISHYAVKKLQGRPTYRYNDKTAVIHKSGWIELLPTLRKGSSWTRVLKKDVHLNDVLKKRDIRPVAGKCRELGLDLIIQISLAYGHESRRALGAWEALQYVRQGYKVLKDPYLGVETDHSYVADMINHLNGEGAKLHSRHVAKLIRNGEFWTEQELVEELRKLGWNADGTPME